MAAPRGPLCLMLQALLLSTLLGANALGKQQSRLHGLSARRSLLQAVGGVQQAARDGLALTSYNQGSLIIPPANSSSGTVPYISFPGLAPPGTQLAAAAANVLPSLDACAAACARLAACNTFFYCTAPGGCSSSVLNVTVPLGGCQLVNQAITQPGTGRPAVLQPAPGFTGGAPLRYAAPAVEGYDAYLGLGFWYRHDLACSGSVSQPGACGVRGGPAGAARARCDSEPLCRFMVWFPAGRDYPGAGIEVTLLKGGLDAPVGNLSEANWNQNSILYVKRTPPPPAAAASSSTSSAALAQGGGGGLSTGAVIGIVVGAAAGTALVAAAVFVWARRRQRRWIQEGLATSSAAGTKASGSTSGSSSKAGRRSSGTAGGASRAPSEVRLAEMGNATQRLPAAVAVGPPCSGRPGSPPLQGGGTPQPPTPLFAAGGSEWPAPPPPPPSIATSYVPSVAPGAGGESVLQWELSLSQPRCAGGLQWQKERAAAAQQAKQHVDSSPHGSPDLLLSQLPADNWQCSVIDPRRIQFCLTAEGCYEELGAGAFATVYKVMLDGVEPLAAKVLRLGGDPRGQLYFLQEAGCLRALRHRNIVGFAGVSVSDSSGILLMELMDGHDLRSRIKEEGRDGQRLFGWWRHGRRVLLELARALHYLHSNSYTHFDVKSRNVLLSRELVAKLADVGFAAQMRATHHSVAGAVGTIDYMAPELITGRQCTSSVDVWSFGCLLWEVCTGHYPQRGSLRPLRVPQECPQEVADLFLACTCEDPKGRPTARALVQRLAELQ